jgi:hypothetical protein
MDGSDTHEPDHFTHRGAKALSRTMTPHSMMDHGGRVEVTILYQYKDRLFYHHTLTYPLPNANAYKTMDAL